jgi:glucose-1-phosphate cytidylyltransferase
MKVVLFCGGQGLRLRAASEGVPKPLVAIGDRPILQHVMQYYAHFGHTEFILCLGHMGDAIRSYFRQAGVPGWKITFAETGTHASIGERLLAARRYVENDQLFLANYADGLTDLHLPDLIEAFAASGKVAALLCTRPALSYHFVQTAADGALVDIKDAEQLGLKINGGYFVFTPAIFDYLRQREDLLDGPLRRLARDGKLLGYHYDGFWRSMDTLKDKQSLDELYAAGRAPWLTPAGGRS